MESKKFKENDIIIKQVNQHLRYSRDPPSHFYSAYAKLKLYSG